MQTYGSWSSALLLGGFCTIYALVFNNYKQAVEKHKKLTDLLNDPTVRVATKSQAK